MLQVGTAGGPFFLLGNNKQVTVPISKSACSKTRGQPLTKLEIDPAEVLREGSKKKGCDCFRGCDLGEDELARRSGGRSLAFKRSAYRL